jgi:hypothetical protein
LYSIEARKSAERSQQAFSIEMKNWPILQGVHTRDQMIDHLAVEHVTAMRNLRLKRIADGKEPKNTNDGWIG